MRGIYQMSANHLPSIRYIDNAVITPPYVHKQRCAEEYIMYIVRQGEMFLTEDKQEYNLKTGDICILDKNKTHMGNKASVCEYYYIHFNHEDIQLLNGEREQEVLDQMLQYRIDSLHSDIYSYDKCEDNQIFLPKLWHVKHKAVWIKLEELLYKAKQENYSPMENYKVMCACYVQQAFMEISRGFLDEEKDDLLPAFPSFYNTISEIAEWLHQEYAGEITRELLEQKFDYSYDYMNRMFKKIIGKTIFQYLTHIRINQAKMLILHTSMRMGEIGKKVGIPDEYYFNKIFKKHVGVPPASYAKNYQ